MNSSVRLSLRLLSVQKVIIVSNHVLQYYAYLKHVNHTYNHISKFNLQVELDCDCFKYTSELW